MLHSQSKSSLDRTPPPRTGWKARAPVGLGTVTARTRRWNEKFARRSDGRRRVGAVGARVGLPKRREAQQVRQAAREVLQRREEDIDDDDGQAAGEAAAADGVVRCSLADGDEIS